MIINIQSKEEAVNQKIQNQIKVRLVNKISLNYSNHKKIVERKKPEY